MVRGYHVYCDVWNATKGDRLSCQRERSNLHDRFAVAVVQNGIIVGHIPQNISAVNDFFYNMVGLYIVKLYTGYRLYSRDLSQVNDEKLYLN